MKVPQSVSSNIEKYYSSIFVKSIATFFGVALLFLSCQNNNINKIGSFTHPPDAPVAVADTFVMLYSDSAIIRFRLETPKQMVFSNQDDPYLEYPNVFFIQKFGPDLSITSSIKANYGKYYEKKELWEARHNVVALTESGDSLITEALFWDERKNMIYSDIFVKVIRKDEILTGIGFEADVRMTNWKFNTPQGHFYIEVDN
jgi:LPS export ABC transporter protein LptC